MNKELINQISEYVEQHIGEFHAARLEKLKKLDLKKLLTRRNPYMYKVMRAMTVGGFVEFLIDDALYKINNDLFKEWMKDVALFVLQTIGNNHCEAPHVVTLAEFCSPEYWESKVGDEDFYTNIIEPAIESCFKEDDECYELKVRHLNRFTKEFLEEYCDSDCAFDWNKLKSAMLWE